MTGLQWTGLRLEEDRPQTWTRTEFWSPGLFVPELLRVCFLPTRQRRIRPPMVALIAGRFNTAHPGFACRPYLEKPPPPLLVGSPNEGGLKAALFGLLDLPRLGLDIDKPYAVSEAGAVAHRTAIIGESSKLSLSVPPPCLKCAPAHPVARPTSTSSGSSDVAPAPFRRPPARHVLRALPCPELRAAIQQSHGRSGIGGSHSRRSLAPFCPLYV